MMNKTNTKEKTLHSGKWTPEEEAYVEGLMEEFRAGTLDLQEGTTLRSFLATKLNCKPKRISKKYEGKNYDGKQLYWNTEEDMSPEERRARRFKLQRLEHKFKECLRAIELVKASRNQKPQPNSLDCDNNSAAAFDDFQLQKQVASLRPQHPQSPLLSHMGMGANADAFLRSASPSAQLPSVAAAASAGLYARGAPAPAEAALALARRHRQQALELELAASSQTGPLLNTMQGLGNPGRMGGATASHLGSLLSTPSSLQHSAARQEAFLGFSGLNRPTSPSALGIHFPRPPSPRSAAASQQSSFLAEAAALEQARMAMVGRRSSGAAGSANAFGAAGFSSAFRPSLNTMLGSSAPTSAVRRSSGNQLAGGFVDETSLMRLQQPSVRDLGATSDFLRQNHNCFIQQQAADMDAERKRQAIEDELSQRKRQRFM